ncbi:MAG: diguanylate cyclase [Deltaproteobacteria bacterium]|nr:MAG: diguanylate cyclase [Deltaproteobacteria bacterium]
MRAHARSQEAPVVAAERTVLIIDDDESIHPLTDAALEGVASRVLHATRPEDGIRIAMESPPSAILLDINLPTMSGLQVCRHLKEFAGTRDVPVVFLTVSKGTRQVARALDCGGADYITKPFEIIELQARVRAALRTKRLIDMLKEQARIDALTGLGNRAAMENALAAASAAYERNKQPLALLLLDLDRFKDVNDEYGHGVGDEVLRRVGAVIRAGCRPYDVACRYGGDEFAIILHQAEEKHVERAAKRLLASIQQLVVPAGDAMLRLTCSGGLVYASGGPRDVDTDTLIRAADAALYRAKEAGRDRLEITGTRATARSA